MCGDTFTVTLATLDEEEKKVEKSIYNNVETNCYQMVKKNPKKTPAVGEFTRIMMAHV